MSGRKTIILGLVFLCAGAAFFADRSLSKKRQLVKDREEALFNFDQKDIASFTLANPHGAFRIEKREEEWRIVEPRELKADKDQAYNVGTGIGTSINAIFDALIDVAGQKLTPRRGPRRPGDVRHSYLDCTRIEGDWGWKASTSLRTGLEQTWQHFVSGQV